MMEENKKKRSYKKLGIACLLSAGVMMATFGGTWAYFNESLSLDNPLMTSNTSVAMVEDYNPNQSFLPGETAIKSVFFENSGDMDLLLRVQVLPDEGWYETVVDANGEKTEKLVPGLSAEKVIKNWSDTWTEKLEDNEEIKASATGTKVEGKVKKQLTKGKDEDSAAEQWGETSEWTKAFPQEVVSDGQRVTRYYRYYRKVLTAKGDNNITSPILNSITLRTDVTNDRHEINYSDKIFKLTFNAEAVPVEDTQQTAAMNEWGMTAEVSADGTVTWTQGTAAGN